MIYFDHNATSPLLPEARQAWLEANEQFPGNPSSLHRIGQRAERALSEAREHLAALLQCDPLQIVWTSGATEANNMVLHHFAQTLDNSADVFISAVEHPSVLSPAQKHFNARARQIPVTRAGIADVSWIEDRLRNSKPGLISVLASNNETGVLQPHSQIAKLCHEYQVPFFSDATQWIGKLPAAEIAAADFLSASAHKFGGPKGAGFLKVPLKSPFSALLHGGEQEDLRRAGTENVAGVLSMMAALRKREAQLRNGEHHVRQQWKQEFEACLAKRIAGIEIVGEAVERLWNTTSVVMPDSGTCDRQIRWVVKLDKGGFAVSTGSACASGREKSSHVFRAMGYSDAEASRVLRFSSGWETTSDDWSALSNAIEQVCR